MNTKNVFTKTVSTILLLVLTCDFILLDAVEPSELVSAFASTASQIIRDSEICLPLFSTKISPEQIVDHHYNLAIRVATDLSSPDPQAFGQMILQASKYFVPFSNYDLETDAVVYAIGQALENKGLLSDASMAVEKAGEFVESLQARVDDLLIGHSWQDLHLALYEGTDLFLKRNGNFSPTDFAMMFKLYAEKMVQDR